MSPKLYEQVYLKWQDVSKTLPEGVVFHYTIQPVETRATEIGREQGGNILGLEGVPQCCKSILFCLAGRETGCKISLTDGI